jgi:hypothetical protein
LGFFNREYDAVVQTNPPDQQKCYCEVALQPGFDCGLLGWRPDDPEAFQLRLIKKIYSALRRDWGQDRNDHLALDLVICPAEAQWIVKALKANIRHESIIAAKE